MDVELFIKRRKQLGYSQVALSKGICTQSTLSKFEKDSQVPSLAILTRLCNRLGLTIDDLTRKDASSARYIRNTLDQVEEGLMIVLGLPRVGDLLHPSRLNGTGQFLLH